MKRKCHSKPYKGGLCLSPKSQKYNLNKSLGITTSCCRRPSKFSKERLIELARQVYFVKPINNLNRSQTIDDESSSSSSSSSDDDEGDKKYSFRFVPPVIPQYTPRIYVEPSMVKEKQPKQQMDLEPASFYESSVSSLSPDTQQVEVADIQPRDLLEPLSPQFENDNEKEAISPLFADEPEPEIKAKTNDVDDLKSESMSDVDDSKSESMADSKTDAMSIADPNTPKDITSNEGSDISVSERSDMEEKKRGSDLSAQDLEWLQIASDAQYAKSDAERDALQEKEFRYLVNYGGYDKQPPTPPVFEHDPQNLHDGIERFKEWIDNTREDLEANEYQDSSQDLESLTRDWNALQVKIGEYAALAQAQDNSSIDVNDLIQEQNQLLVMFSKLDQAPPSEPYQFSL